MPVQYKRTIKIITSVIIIRICVSIRIKCVNVILAIFYDILEKVIAGTDP